MIWQIFFVFIYKFIHQILQNVRSNKKVILSTSALLEAKTRTPLLFSVVAIWVARKTHSQQSRKTLNEPFAFPLFIIAMV